MLKQTLRFLLVFLIFGSTFGKTGYAEDIDELEEYRRFIGWPLKYLFMAGGIILSGLIRHLVHNLDVPVPYPAFTIMGGLLWGIGSLYNVWMRRVTTLCIGMLHGFEFVYLPLIIFTISFSIDVHSFFRSLSQIMIIAGPVACTSAIITGLAIRLVISDNWSRVDAVLFGSIFICSYPIDAMRFLRETSVHNKHVNILMHGETLMTTSWSYTLYTCLINHMMGYVIYWYQFVMNIVRQLCLSIPLGYCWGLVGSKLMKMAYNDSIGLILITVSVAFTGFYFIEWISNAGILGTLVVGVVMGSKRPSLSQAMNKTILTYWRLLCYLMSDIIFLYVGIIFPSILADELGFKDFAMVLVTYLVTNISRFLSFLLFSPILSRLGYGMSFQSMVFCVWVGLKNPICLDMALNLGESAFYNDARKSKIFVLHVVLVYVMMMCINGSCVKRLINALGMSELSVSRQINMNNCMKFIYEARNRTVAILKMDRFVSDANWPLVIETTNMKQPYRKYKQEALETDEEIDENFMGYKYTYCPDCQSNILNEPTAKELREMTKEAKMRILKLKKTAYSRLFENGMISKKGIRSLHQAVDVAMDSEELVIELDGLFKLFEKEGFFYRFLRNVLQLILRDKYEKLKPPRIRWRLFCYRVIRNDIFFVMINLIVLCHFLMLTYYITLEFNVTLAQFENFVQFRVFEYSFLGFVLVYLIELLLKIFGLSWIYVFKHGVCYYFKSYTNIIDFVIVCMCLVTIFMHFIFISFHHFKTYLYAECVLDALLSIRVIRVVTFLRYCRCCSELTPTIIKHLESKIDRHRAMAFEIGKNYIAGEEEILQNLEQIIDQDQIRELIKEKIQADRLTVTRRLGIAQKEAPQVAQTVKTKLVMRTVLSAMKQDAQELKTGGWVDDIEYRQLLKSLGEREAFINSIKQIEPSSTKVIFREIGYMGNNEQLVKYLYSNVITKKFGPGEVVLGEGSVVSNIYILITGMLKVCYTPKPDILRNLTENGLCPVVDYLFSMTYEESMCDYILPGTTIGEKALLTERPYDGLVIAETQSQVYVLTKAVIQQALTMNDDPVTGFECHFWKYLCQAQALLIMTTTSSYRTYTQDKIKYLLERGFSPNLSNYKYLIVNQMIADVLLIEGIVIDINARDVYTAPSYIPRAVQKLVFPHGSTIQLQTRIETRLLIIPAKDYNEYEIMLTQEEMCELVNPQSSKCLWRYVEQNEHLIANNPKTVKQLERIMIKYKKKTSDSSHLNKVLSDHSTASKRHTIK